MSRQRWWALRLAPEKKAVTPRRDQHRQYDYRRSWLCFPLRAAFSRASSGQSSDRSLCRRWRTERASCRCGCAAIKEKRFVKNNYKQAKEEFYQMKGEIVNLMEGLPADLTLKGLLIVVRQLVVFVVALLVEALAAELALIGFVAGVDAHVGVQRGAPIEGFAAVGALMRLLRRVDDLVAAKG